MIAVEIAGTRFAVRPGTSMQELCDSQDTPVVFGCRAAQCGACLVQILDGAGNLSPIAPDEQAVLDILAESADCRLACQTTLHGPVSLRIAD
ncbi:2Fe-2S iron-sulfur cluster-binding protein [Crossiella sp. CA198]|uniref:2Fe-2S iron-sulfur cluster-binding protein n=1 Tax=Crossiella sp. CA198 TaxID=3455607 RepID=UPI003F8D646F